MKNLPPNLQTSESESEEARLARQEAERQQYLADLNFVLGDEMNRMESIIDVPVGLSLSPSKNDLLFLYQFPGSTYNSFFEGADPANITRRAALLKKAIAIRDHSADLAVMLDCRRDQIANTPHEITPNTKAYIGDLVQKDKGGNIIPIFFLLPSSVNHIYTTFPEQKIRKEQLEIGGKSVEQLRTDLAAENFQFYDNGLLDSDDFRQSIYEPPSFTKLKSKEIIPLIRFTVAQLGFPKGATTKEIFDRALALGLELCPPEVGPYYRIQYANQPIGEYIRVGMKTILDRDLNPRIFSVNRDVDDLWLRDSWASPGHGWGAGYQLVFRLSKSNV